MIRKLLAFTILVGISYLVWKVGFAPPPSPPDLDYNEWWGPKGGKEDSSIRSFKIQFTDAIVKDLRSRLLNHRPFTPPLEGTFLEYGMNTNQMKGLINYWASKYPFAAREKIFNKYPQYKTIIQGLDIHFVRVKPEVKPGVTVIPLICLHGWPGSFREFYEAIPLLTAPRPGYDFVFEVVVPSLPGFGFSDGAVRPGLSSTRVSVVLRNLMQRLGHKQFFVQGGDWGSVIGSAMATLFPDEVLGYHSNMLMLMEEMAFAKIVVGALMPSMVIPEERLIDRLYPLSKFVEFLIQEFGYLHHHATKPDTLGLAINESPVGLAAYIAKKMAIWTVPFTKSLATPLPMVGVVDNLMVYWVSNCLTTSMRLYAETFSKEHLAIRIDAVPTTVPAWALQAKYELFYQPPFVIKSKFPNLQGTTILETGGHFLALELPAEVATDVFKAVKIFRLWHQDQEAKKTYL